MIKEVVKEHPSKVSVYDKVEKIKIKYKLLTFGGNTEGSCICSRYMFNMLFLCTCDWSEMGFSSEGLLLWQVGLSATVLLHF